MSEAKISLNVLTFVSLLFLGLSIDFFFNKIISFRCVLCNPINVGVRCGRGSAFYNLGLGLSLLVRLYPLAMTFTSASRLVFFFFYWSPSFRWDSKSSVKYSWVFPFLQVRQALLKQFLLRADFIKKTKNALENNYSSNPPSVKEWGDFFFSLYPLLWESGRAPRGSIPHSLDLSISKTSSNWSIIVELFLPCYWFPRSFCSWTSVLESCDSLYLHVCLSHLGSRVFPKLQF